MGTATSSSSGGTAVVTNSWITTGISRYVRDTDSIVLRRHSGGEPRGRGWGAGKVTWGGKPG